MNAQKQTVLEQVRQLDRLGVPHTKIGERFGVHRNTIKNWLVGTHAPAADKRQEEFQTEAAPGAATPKGLESTPKDATKSASRSAPSVSEGATGCATPGFK